MLTLNLCVRLVLCVCNCAFAFAGSSSTCHLSDIDFHNFRSHQMKCHRTSSVGVDSFSLILRERKVLHESVVDVWFPTRTCERMQRYVLCGAVSAPVDAHIVIRCVFIQVGQVCMVRVGWPTILQQGRHDFTRQLF